jgi:hypothetical protein
MFGPNGSCQVSCISESRSSPQIGDRTLLEQHCNKRLGAHVERHLQDADPGGIPCLENTMIIPDDTPRLFSVPCVKRGKDLVSNL